jgi:hypothetical protein
MYRERIALMDSAQKDVPVAKEVLLMFPTMASRRLLLFILET